MRVDDVMTKQVSFCNPATNAVEAAGMMWAQGNGTLPVLETGGRPVGLVTGQDLFIALGTTNRRPSDLAVGEIMETDISHCAPDDHILTALRTMARRQVPRLAVVDQAGLFRGVLSMDDIIGSAGTVGCDLSSEVIIYAMRKIYGCSRASRA